LLWVGDGVVLPALMSQAKKLNVDDMIISLGRQPFEEVPNLYSLVDVSAFPRKGFEICEIVSPLKPFESMAMGKAVVVSSVRPLQEIVTHKKTGLVHEKDNAESLAEALRVMITKPALRQKYAAAAREWLVATRNWDKIAADVSAVYETLSQKKPKQKKISEKKTLKSTTQKTQPRGRAKGSVTKKTSKKEKTSP
ncbi:MAG: glycosyltransferase, partial [Alphaproteobacteria bacterium]|nr:glycosyltransferase [Alphaproteobacteria bacterium]